MLIQNNTNDFSQIANSLDLNSSNFEFSFTLDDFAKSFGNTYGLDINNYSDLTDLANAQHGANWTVEEYASAYQANVDIILAGFQDNGTWGSTGSTETDNWTEEFSGDGAYCAIVGNGLVRYVSSQNGNIYKFVYRANGSEDYWTRITPSLNSPSFI